VDFASDWFYFRVAGLLAVAAEQLPASPPARIPHSMHVLRATGAFRLRPPRVSFLRWGLRLPWSLKLQYKRKLQVFRVPLYASNIAILRNRPAVETGCQPTKAVGSLSCTKGHHTYLKHNWGTKCSIRDTSAVVGRAKMLDVLSGRHITYKLTSRLQWNFPNLANMH
jgi:hypothetical protein